MDVVARGRTLLTSYGPVGLFVIGLALVVAAVLAGEAEVDLVVVIPVVSGSGPMMLGGVAMIALGFLTGFAALALSSGSWQYDDEVAPSRPGRSMEGPRTRYGGLVMIGPVPIAFGSDRKLAKAMMVIGITIAALVLIALVI
jgi:uncharacterized protein (TIGR00304 family)